MDIIGIGTGELILIALLALLVLGPERLVVVARRAGRTIRQLRRALNQLDAEVPPELREVGDTMAELRSAGRDLGRSVARSLRDIEQPLSIPDSHAARTVRPPAAPPEAMPPDAVAPEPAAPQAPMLGDEFQDAAPEAEPPIERPPDSEREAGP
jgi:sec-independent protein translocase protein TatB